jgi:hypothetical protein
VIECDWRELIYQMANDYYKYGQLDSFELKVKEANPFYPFGITGYEQYYTDIKSFWRDIYTIDSDEESGWAPEVNEAPATLNFWFDFLDYGGELAQFNVKNVGSRPKAINDNNVKAI